MKSPKNFSTKRLKPPGRLDPSPSSIDAANKYTEMTELDSSPSITSTSNSNSSTTKISPKQISGLSNRLLFAVPKKGRLNEPAMQLLKGADFQFTRKSRLDIALCQSMPIAFVFLPASDIPQFVGEGSVDLGITGLDVIQEARMQDECEVLLGLGFGKCRLCVQVPLASGVSSVSQLVGRRIVTSFEQLAADYFHNLSSSSFDDDQKKTRISYISGSVEAACSLGLADAIVDLVESGETMRAAQLKDIATILESEAVLISKKPASVKHQNNSSNNASIGDDDNWKQSVIDIVKNRIAGVLAANQHVLVKYNIPKDKLKQATAITPGKCAPTISPLNNDEWLAVEAMIVKNREGIILDQLHDCGAKDILVLELKNCRV